MTSKMIKLMLTVLPDLSYSRQPFHIILLLFIPLKPFESNKHFEKNRDLDLITPLTESEEPINLIVNIFKTCKS